MTIKDIIELETKLTHMFDSDQRVAMALLEHIRNNKKEMLEKEKEEIHPDSAYGQWMKRFNP
jgi:hypothetical protein